MQIQKSQSHDKNLLSEHKVAKRPLPQIIAISRENVY